MNCLGAVSTCRKRSTASRVSISTPSAGVLWAPADYLAIAERFHTIIVDRIPALSSSERDAAKRLIILVDTLYDMHVKLVASAAAEPEALFAGADGAETIEFARAASRLIEMRSTDYLALPHGREAGRQAGDLRGIAET